MIRSPRICPKCKILLSKEKGFDFDANMNMICGSCKGAIFKTEKEYNVSGWQDNYGSNGNWNWGNTNYTYVPKIARTSDGGFIFYCVACKYDHTIPKGFVLTGDLSNPTIYSTLGASDWLYYTEPETCWFKIKNGAIIYGVKSTHKYKNKTVSMVPYSTSNF